MSVLSIAYLAILAGCAVAALLTAIIFLIKKKAGKPLALYAVCVLALLGLGFLESVYNPVPNPRHTEPEPVVVSPGSQNPPTPWAIEPEPAPVETVPVDAASEPAPESAPIVDTVEEVPAESPEIAVPLRTSRPAAPASVSTTVQAQEPAAEPVPVPLSVQTQAPAPMSLSTFEPSLGDEPEYAPMSNPELVSDAEPAAVSNPEVAGSPEVVGMFNPELWDDGVRLSVES